MVPIPAHATAAAPGHGHTRRPSIRTFRTDPGSPVAADVGHQNLCLLVELDSSTTVFSTPNKARHKLAFCTPFSALQFLTFDKPET